LSRVVICPLCKTKGTIPDDPPAPRIRCSFCRSIFKVEGPAPDPSSVAPMPTAGASLRQAALSASALLPSQNAAFDDSEEFWPGYRLRLMSSVKDVCCIPTAGEGLIIVAVVHHVLHFRIFNHDAKMVVDTDAKRLIGQAHPIEELRQRLESLWRPHELTQNEEVRVIRSVTSIVGHTPGPPAPATDSRVRRSPVESSNDTDPTPVMYGLLRASWVEVVVLLAVLVFVLTRGGDGPAADVALEARAAGYSQMSTTEPALAEETTSPGVVGALVLPTAPTTYTPTRPSASSSTVIDSPGRHRTPY